MLFNSMQFAVFFPIAVLLYFIIPHKARTVYLLVLSYIYYMCWRAEYALLMFLSTFITFLSGMVIDKYRDCTDMKGERIRKGAVAVSFILNLLILGFFKYYGFMSEAVNSVLDSIGIKYTLPAFDVLLPVGISFYIFQALSYTVDVYRKEIPAEKNLLKYALFVSFFPQLVAGPIERSKNLLKQFDEVHHFDYERVRLGLFRMLWGFFMKLVIAQRLSIVADLIYENSDTSTGYQLLLGTIVFAFQIYCDFASYSEIAIGAAKVLGFELMENFRQPFFSKSCKELWNRWHISLNTWFRDYLYFPLGGSRKGAVRKHVNLMIVFLLSGLWHGAAWTYVIWGGLSGLFQVFGELLKPVREKLGAIVHLKKGTAVHSFICIITTFMFFCTSLVFFRSESLSQAVGIMGKIFTDFGFASVLTTRPTALGLGGYHLLILIVAMLILFVVDLLKEKSERSVEIKAAGAMGTGGFYEKLLSSPYYVRWSCYFALVILILLSANFGSEEFIYFQF